LVAALAAVLFLVMSAGAWGALRTLTAVPDVAGQPVPVAVERITAAQLTTATMGTVATTDFGNGVVVDQLPAQSTAVPVGSAVDLLVAVSPTMTVVPDVSLDTTLVAQSVLVYSLLKPIVYEQLSDTVDYGRVVAQLPRAGQALMTGQPVAIFVSMGRGTGGAVVPSVVGQTLGEAATHISDVYLLAQLYNMRPGMSMSDKVTDQVPAPGTRVPVGSAIALLGSGSPN
jgi:beta-lactam-binding protein with PASTA domain